MTTIDTKPNPIAALINGLVGKSTAVDVKPNPSEIHISLEGIEQKLALKHIRNLINEMLGDSN